MGGLSFMEISLALGGGGSKGFAHLGVLRCLEKKGYKICAVAGTSAGGIVAAIYAAGYSPLEMLERFQQLDQAQLYRRQPGDGPALLGIAGLNQLLKEMLGERTFDDLKIPCALTAVDLNTGKEVILKRGRVADAVLATVALPGIFPPKSWQGYYLVDGGLLDPVPVALARSLAPFLPVVAVVLTNLEPEPLKIMESLPFLPDIPLLRQITHLRVAQAFNVFLHSIDISSQYLTMMRLKIERPEVVISPELKDIGILDQVDLTEISNRGERAAEAVLPELRRKTSWSSRIGRYFRIKQPATIETLLPAGTDKQ
jgi:NTE family protein